MMCIDKIATRDSRQQRPVRILTAEYMIFEIVYEVDKLCDGFGFFDLAELIPANIVGHLVVELKALLASSDEFLSRVDQLRFTSSNEVVRADATVGILPSIRGR